MISGWLRDTCKVGAGAACCRYVTMGAAGWGCAKVDATLKRAIDQRAASMKAQGDNCEGVDDLEVRGNGIIAVAGPDSSLKMMDPDETLQ